jgi:hypothetical protein
MPPHPNSHRRLLPHTRADVDAFARTCATVNYNPTHGTSGISNLTAPSLLLSFVPPLFMRSPKSLLLLCVLPPPHSLPRRSDAE